MRIKTFAVAAVLAMAGVGLTGCHDHPGYAGDHHRGGHWHRGDGDHYRY